jgi:hypothetical protein
MLIRAVLLSAGFLALSSAAFAQGARVMPRLEEAQGDTLQMNCAQAKGSVKGSGGIVLKSGPNHFDLYHRSGGTCSRLGESMQPAFVRSKDNPVCFIGYTCEEDVGN